MDEGYVDATLAPQPTSNVVFVTDTTSAQGASETPSSPLDVTMLAMLGLTMAGAGVMKSQSAQKKQQELAQANALAQAQLATAKAEQAQTASANWEHNQTMQANATQKVYTQVQQSQVNIDFWTSYTAWKIKVAEAEEKRRQAELEARIKAYYAALRLRPVSSQPVESMPVLGLLKGLLTGAKILGQGIKTVKSIVKAIAEKNGATGGVGISNSGAGGFVSGTGGAGGGSSIGRGQEDESCDNPFINPFTGFMSDELCNTSFITDSLESRVLNSTVTINFVRSCPMPATLDNNALDCYSIEFNARQQATLGTVVVINGQEFISTHDHFGNSTTFPANNCNSQAYLQQYDFMLIDGNLGERLIPISDLTMNCQAGTGIQLFSLQNAQSFGITSYQSQISSDCNLETGDFVFYPYIPDWNGFSLDGGGYQRHTNIVLGYGQLFSHSPDYIIDRGFAGSGDSGSGLFNLNGELCGNFEFNNMMLRGIDPISRENIGLNTLSDIVCNGSQLIIEGLGLNDYNSEYNCRYNVFNPIIP